MSLYLILFQSQFAQRKENELANNPVVIDLNVLNRAYCAGIQQDAVQWIFVEGSDRNCKKQKNNKKKIQPCLGYDWLDSVNPAVCSSILIFFPPHST